MSLLKELAEMADPGSHAPMPLHQEFDVALAEEIAAVTARGHRTIPLQDGVFITRTGDRFLYQFTLESPRAIQEDSAGRFQVEGEASIEADVVSVDVTLITLALSRDFGERILKASFSTDPSFLLKRLRQRLQNQELAQNPLGQILLGQSKPHIQPVPVDQDGLAHQASEDQRRAIGAALGGSGIFIWGPPGTGKSFTIGLLSAMLANQNKPLLLCAHTNRAVDQALWNLLQHLQKHGLLCLVDEGKILRIGTPADSRIRQCETILLSHQIKRHSQQLVQRKSELTSQIQQIESDLQAWVLYDQATEALRETEGEILFCRHWLDKHLQMQHAKEHCETARIRAVADKDRLEQLRPQAEELDSLAQQVDALRPTLERHLSEARRKVEIQRNLQQALEREEAILKRSREANFLERIMYWLPYPDVQEQTVAQLRTNIQQRADDLAQTEQSIQEIRGRTQACEKAHQRFHDEQGFEPKGIKTVVARVQQELDSTRREITRLAREQKTHVNRLPQHLKERLGESLTSVVSNHLDTLQQNLQDQKEQLQHIEKSLTGTSRHVLENRRNDLQAQLATLENQLRQVETKLVSGALVIASTLSQAYLRDSIQARTFHTIVIDEVSMAPIPAVCAVTSRATHAAIAVGDFLQLAPIVEAKTEMAKKWLGRDLFTVAELDKPDCSARNFCALRQQRRMCPEIAEIANHFFYDDTLKNLPQEDSDFSDWFVPVVGLPSAVGMINTKDLEAWAIQPLNRRGEKFGMCNYVSASLSVTFAQAMLKPNRTTHQRASAPRILICCYYKHQAQFIRALLHQKGLAGEVEAGTIHSMQGAEADIVIYDLVVDRQVKGSVLFKNQCDQDIKRALNVAITRARYRLYFIGHFDYVRRNGANGFIGRDLLPWLIARYPPTDAKELFPELMKMAPAQRQADHATFTNETEFFDYLDHDLAECEHQVVFFSPFLTKHRLNERYPSIRPLLQQGKLVIVLTKPAIERGDKRESHQELISKLLQLGVRVVELPTMHEKAVFIDTKIAWVGSLNPLSHRNSTESMLRLSDPRLVQEARKHLQVDDRIRSAEETHA